MAKRFAGRAGEKLEYALQAFDVDVTGLVCADFGCAVGGFTDCLLKAGAARVYAVDTAYGTLDWTLRNDERVVVMERTNAMHVELPEKADLVTLDVGWTRLEKIVPKAMDCLKPDRFAIALLKPQYESTDEERERGTVKAEFVEGVVARVTERLKELGVEVGEAVESPLLGGKGENREFLIRVRPPSSAR